MRENHDEDPPKSIIFNKSFSIIDNIKKKVSKIA